MPEPEFAAWEHAFRVALAAAEQGAWEAARTAACELAASLTGASAAEWQELCVESHAVLRAATLALQAGRLDAASALVPLCLELIDEANALGALSSRDFERVVAISGGHRSIVEADEQQFWVALSDQAVEGLFASDLPDANLLALYMMEWTDRESTSTTSRQVRADRAAAHGFHYPHRREAALVNRALVKMCQRRRGGPDGALFERFSGLLGGSVVEVPELIVETAHCARACLANGSRNVRHFQTAIVFALLSGNEEEARIFRTAAEKALNAKVAENVWRWANDTAKDLRQRRGPAGCLTADDWTDEQARLWSALVPVSGPAPTVQGELIRCTGRLSDEAYRNGNGNFGPLHVAMIDFVERTLALDNVFTPDEMVEIRADVETIRSNDEPIDLNEHDSCYYRLSACAVRWCRAHPTPIVRDS